MTESESMEAFRARLAEWRAKSPAEQHAEMANRLGGFRPAPDDGSNRLRVGLWAPGIGLGGAEHWMLALARHVPPDRVQWSGLAVTEASGPHSPEMAESLGAHMPVGYGREAARSLAGTSDVILSWAVLDVSEALRGVSPRPRVVQALHLPPGPGWGAETERMLATVDRFAAVSGLALEGTPDFARSRSSVVWNCVDPARLVPSRSREEMRKLWGVPVGSKVVGFLGRLSDEKDPTAMARLVPHLPQGWHAVVVGEGPLSHHLSGIDRLHAVGPDADAGSVLNAFDVLASPSLYESFGLSIAEGLWLGLPVASTPAGIARIVPGLAREIGFGASGEAMAAAVVEAERAGPRPGSREWARENLDPARFGKQWADLLCSVGKTSQARLAMIAACPDRGPVLPVSLQDDCGCSGRELSECRAGKGAVPGRATLAECQDCRMNS